MIYFLMPLFGGLAAWMILGEQLRGYHLLSGILIVSGILINNQAYRRKKTGGPSGTS